MKIPVNATAVEIKRVLLRLDGMRHYAEMQVLQALANIERINADIDQCQALLEPQAVSDSAH